MGKILLPEDYNKLTLNQDNVPEKTSKPKFIMPREEDQFLPTLQGYEFKESKYDVGRPAFKDPNEHRAEEQTLADKWANGLVKFAGTAGTTFEETFTDLIYGLPKAIASGELHQLYDNPVNQQLDKVNQSLQENFPTYYSKAEQEDSLLKSMTKANFWSDKVLNGLGFTVGAIGGGLVTGGVGDYLMGLSRGSKVVQSLSKLSAAERELALAENGFKTVEDLNKFAKNLKFKQAANATLSGAIATSTEADIQARQGRERFINEQIDAIRQEGRQPSEQELQDITDTADAIGNIIYALNLPIIGMPNFVQFGKLFSKGYNLERKILNEGLEPLSKIQKGYNIFKNPISEFFQETNQQAVDTFANDYFTKKYNNKGESSLNDLVESVGKGLIDAYGSKNGLEQGLLGFIIGSIGAPIPGHIGGGIREGIKENQKINRNTALAKASLEKYKLSDQFKPLYDAAVSHYSYEQDKTNALQDGDIFAYKNAETNQFFNLVNSRIQTGQFDNLIDEIESYSSLSDDELKKILKLNPDESLPKNSREFVQTIKEKAKEIHDINESTEANFPRLSKESKEFLNYAAYRISDIDRREKKLSLDLFNITGIDYSSLRRFNPKNYKALLTEQFNSLLGDINPSKVKEARDYALDLQRLTSERELLIKSYQKAADTQLADREAIKAEKTQKEEKVTNETPPPPVESDFDDDGSGDFDYENTPTQTSFTKDGKTIQGDLWTDSKGNQWIKVKENNKSINYPVVKNDKGEFEFKQPVSTPKTTKVPIIKNNTFNRRYLTERAKNDSSFATEQEFQQMLQTPLTPDRVKLELKDNTFEKTNNPVRDQSKNIIDPNITVQSPTLEFIIYIDGKKVGYMPYSNKYFENGKPINLTSIDEVKRLFVPSHPDNQEEYDRFLREFISLKNFEDQLSIWLKDEDTTKEVTIPNEAASTIITGDLDIVPEDQRRPSLDQVPYLLHNGEYIIYDSYTNDFLTPIRTTRPNVGDYTGKWALATMPNQLSQWVKISPKSFLDLQEPQQLVDTINRVLAHLNQIKEATVQNREVVSSLFNELKIFVAYKKGYNINFVPNLPTAQFPHYGIEVRISKNGEEYKEAETIRIRNISSLDDLVNLINTNKHGVKIDSNSFKIDSSYYDPATKTYKTEFNPNNFVSSVTPKVFKSYNIKFNFHPENLGFNVTPEEIKSTILDPKADIERRRQEELDNLFSQTQASTDKQLNTPVQKLSKEEINRNIETAKQQNKDLIEELEKEFKENTDNKASDEVWDKWDKKSDKLDNNLPQGVSFKITDGKVDLFDNQSYRESNFGGNRITQVSVASLHRQTEKFEVGDRIQVQDGVRALPAEVTKVNENGKILEAKTDDGRTIISKGNIVTTAPINDRLKINAKYDAELKALEQTTSTTQSESNPALRDVESTAKEFTVEEDNKIKDIAIEANTKVGSYVKSVPTGRKNRFANNINEFEATNPFTNEKKTFKKQSEATEYVINEIVKANTKKGREEIFQSLLSKEQPTQEEGLSPKIEKVELYSYDKLPNESKDDTSQLTENWRNTFEELKAKKDNEGIQILYNKLKVLQNGVIQGKAKSKKQLDNTLADVRELEKDIEDYAEQQKTKKIDNETETITEEPNSEPIIEGVEGKATSTSEVENQEAVEEADALIEHNIIEIPKKKSRAKKVVDKVKEIVGLKRNNVKEIKADFISQIEVVEGLKEDKEALIAKGYEVDGKGNVTILVKDDGTFSFPINDVKEIKAMVEKEFPSNDKLSAISSTSGIKSRKVSQYYQYALNRGSLERNQIYVDNAKYNVDEANKVLEQAKKDGDTKLQKQAEKLLEIFNADLQEQEAILNYAVNIDYEIENTPNLRNIASDLLVSPRELLDLLNDYKLVVTKENAENVLLLDEVKKNYGTIDNAKVELQKGIDDIKKQAKEKYGYKNKEGQRKPKNNKEVQEQNRWVNKIQENEAKIKMLDSKSKELDSIDKKVLVEDTKGKEVYKIVDVGEKIGGAKKDLANQLGNITVKDIESQPLSKSFPEPNYKLLVEEGIITKDEAIFLKYLYDNIPSKPRKAYRVASWVSKVQNAIDTFKGILGSETLRRKLINGDVEKNLGDNYAKHKEILEAFGFPENEINLGGYEITRDYIKGNYMITKGNYIIKDGFATIQDAVFALQLNNSISKGKGKNIKFNVYQDTKTKEYFIGKKGATGVVRVVEGLNRENAHKFLKDNQEKLESIWNGMKANPNERRLENRNRVGTDWRKGENISGEKFAEVFGFRGVEFGNWVNNSERQQSVNDAYDAFMDMANILGISPSAISLNGELGFAFGARGSGKHSAHYERDKVVINLTKTKGAGSLAHEWFHALDNYFARVRGYKGEFITDSPRQRVNRDGTKDISVRPEVLESFNKLVKAINASDLPKRSRKLDATRSQPYWSTTIEMGARAFENYLIEKLAENNESNDYLANFKELGEWINDSGESVDAINNFPYPLETENESINNAFQELFDVIQEKKEGDKTILFSLGKETKGKFTKLGKETFDKFAKRLKAVFPKIKLNTFTDWKEALGVSQEQLDLMFQVEEDYRGWHKAPRKEGKNSLDDMSDIFPDDLYSINGFRYYADDKNGKADRESYEQILKSRNKPNRKVKVYRAVPKGINKINSGDWVSLSKTYAKKHGENHIQGEYEILEIEIEASKLFNEGSINEFGVQFLRTPNGTVYGFVKDGQVFINENELNANTLVHEYGHIFAQILKAQYPTAHKNLIDRIKQEKALIEAKRKDPNYANLTDEQLADEVLNELIGNKGETILNTKKPIHKEILDLLNRFWNRLKNIFTTGSPNIAKWSVEQFQNATIDDIVNNVTADLLSGRKLSNVSSDMLGGKSKFQIKDNTQFDYNNPLHNDLNELLNDYISITEEGETSLEDLKDTVGEDLYNTLLSELGENFILSKISPPSIETFEQGVKDAKTSKEKKDLSLVKRGDLTFGEDAKQLFDEMGRKYTPDKWKEIEPKVDEYVQKLLASPNFDEDVENIIKYISDTSTTELTESKGLATAQTMLLNKIAFHAYQMGKKELFKKVFKFSAERGKVFGQAIAAYAEASTPESLLNQAVAIFEGENDQVLNTIQPSGKTMLEELEDVLSKISITAEQVEQVLKQTEAKRKGVTQRAKKPRTQPTQTTDKPVSAKQREKANDKIKDAKARLSDWFKENMNIGFAYNPKEEAEKTLKLVSILKDLAIGYLQLGTSNITYIKEQIQKSLGDKIKIDDVWSQVYDDEVSQLHKQNQKDAIINNIVSQFKDGKTSSTKDVSSIIARSLALQAKKISGKKSTQTDMAQRVKELLENKDLARQAWEEALSKAKKEINAKNIPLQEKIDLIHKIEDAIGNFIAIPQSISRKAIRKGMKDVDTTIDDLIKSHFSQKEAKMNDIVKAIVDNTGLSLQDSIEYYDILYKEFNDMLSEKQTKQLEKTLYPKKITRKQKNEVQKMVEAINMGALGTDSFIQAFGEKFGLKKLTEEQVANIKKFTDLMYSTDGEIRRRLAKELSDYIDDLKPWDARKIAKVITNAVIFHALSGITSIAQNIPLGSTLSTITNLLPVIIMNPIRTVRFLGAYNKAGLSGTGTKALADTLRSGYNDMDFFLTEDDMLKEGSTYLNFINKLGFDNPKDFLTSVIYKIPMHFAYMASAFDNIINHRGGELLNFLGEYNLAPKEVGDVYTKVLERMGYDKASTYSEQVDEEIEDIKALGMKVPIGYKERRVKELMVAGRNKELQQQAYETIKTYGLMGQPDSILGFIYNHSLKKWGNIKDTDNNLMVALKTILNITLGMFTRITVAGIEMSLKSTPIFGLMMSAYKYDSKTDKFRATTWEEKKKALAMQAIVTGTLIAILAEMFDYDDDELKLNPNRRIDITGSKIPFFDRETLQGEDGFVEPLSFGYRKKDGTMKYVSFAKYIPVFVPLLAFVGNMRDKLEVRDTKQLGKEEFDTNSIKVDASLLLSLITDTFSAQNVASYNTIGNFLTDMVKARSYHNDNPDIQAQKRREKVNKVLFKTFVSRPGKTLLMPNLYKSVVQLTEYGTDATETMDGVYKNSIKEFYGLDHLVNHEQLDMFGNEVKQPFPIFGLDNEDRYDFPEWKMLIDKNITFESPYIGEKATFKGEKVEVSQKNRLILNDKLSIIFGNLVRENVDELKEMNQMKLLQTLKAYANASEKRLKAMPYKEALKLDVKVER